jgi:hypothetical protein
MSDVDADNVDAASFAALKAHAEALERQLHDVEKQSAARLREVELKAEAVRAGILDLEGLKFLDPSTVSAQGADTHEDAARVIAKLRREKPWLFAVANSSSTAAAPQAAPIKRKLATEMSVEEWRAARAELLRRR